VIGNPPYIQLQSMKNDPTIALLADKNYQTYTKTGDIYCLFYEKATQILKPNGLFCYITSNKWMRAGYGEKTRNFFATQTNPLTLIDFGGYQVFDSATVDSNILLAQKSENQYHLQAFTVDKSTYNPKISLTDYAEERLQPAPRFGSDAWTIQTLAADALKSKIEAVGKPLKDWDNISVFRGITSGLNEAFVIDTETKIRLCDEDPKSAEIIKPILRGKDIKKWQAEWAGLWLINTHNGIKQSDIPAINVLKQYPAIFKHLATFLPQIEKRDDKGEHWSNLRSCAYWQKFEEEKIIYMEIMTDNPADGYPFPCFSYDTNSSCLLNTSYMMNGNPNDLKYILGVLNSSVGKFLVKQYVVKLQEKQFRMLAQHVSEFPIPVPTENDRLLMEGYVDEAIRLRSAGLDTSLVELQMNELSYRLYGLSEDEVGLL